MGEAKKRIPIPPYLRFVFGGASGFNHFNRMFDVQPSPHERKLVPISERRMLAICIVQPMDLIKTRMQLLGPVKNMTSFKMAQDVVKKDGFMGLYTGLSAALFRQATYTTGRLGSFTYLTDLYTAAYGTPNFAAKLLTGVVAGSIGALIGNPAEVALVRMTADGRLPPDQRRNYKNVFDALFRMVKFEGAGVLLRGASATVSRAAVVNSAQLGTYAQAREMLLPALTDGVFLHFCASMISGFVTSVASLPLDAVKTRVQNSGRSGQKVSMISVMMDVVNKDGVGALWRGLLPTYMKIGPHTVLTFIFLEQINAAYYRMTG